MDLEVISLPEITKKELIKRVIKKSIMLNIKIKQYKKEVGECEREFKQLQYNKLESTEALFADRIHNGKAISSAED